MIYKIFIAASQIIEVLMNIDHLFPSATRCCQPGKAAARSDCKLSSIDQHLDKVITKPQSIDSQTFSKEPIVSCQGREDRPGPPIYFSKTEARGRYARPLLVFIFFACAQTFAQEPQIDQGQMPRVSATEPEDALDTFEIRDGFQLKLAAHEPDVVDPIAIAFDADGGMYVIEMRGYSEHREDRLGRIRYLEDEDGDGIFETSSIFKDGLKWPTGIACYKGGVFVGATPDIFYFKDKDGDGVSDEEQLVFTGFGPTDSRLNMQALFNSFRWGPDNRIWGATAASGGNVTRPGDPSFESVSIRGADFSFNPETLDFRAENGTAQYGLSFDSYGRRFVCSNSRHAIWVAYERHHVKPNPYYDLPAPLVDIARDGAAAPVYRISPDEPWRIVRTRWRVSGVVKGMIEGGGRVSGYFTSASGIHIYWGEAFGETFQDNIFVGDVGSNLVHRKIITHEQNRYQPVAIRPEDEQQTEFLRSRDNWFRPASFATGPDGCLYICDMYRETIEHPWSLPQGIKAHLDLDSGNNRGRIYRVEPDGFARPSIPKLSEASDAELIALVEETEDDWRRTTARRLLFERGKPIKQDRVPYPYPALLKAEATPLVDFSSWNKDPWMDAAILNSLHDEAWIRFAWDHRSAAMSARFEEELARMSGKTGSLTLIESIASLLGGVEVSPHLMAMVSALKEGFTLAGGDWEEIATLGIFSSLFTRAARIAENELADLDSRLAAIGLLELQSGREIEAVLKRIVSENAAQNTLIAAAAKGIEDAAFLIENFNRLPPETRREIVVRLTNDAQDALGILAAIETGTLTLEQIPADAAQRLRNHREPKVAARALQTLPRIEMRSEVVVLYQAALASNGDIEKGQAAFRKACITCHQTSDGEGYVFGPPIATFKTAGKTLILGNILDPNREVAPQYQAFQFTMKNGEAYAGMIASEDKRNVTVALPGGVTKTFPRTEVESMTGLGRSLMPEGLEHSLTIEEMTDLLAYLVQ